MLVLALNAGSSSLKFSLLDSIDERQLFHGQFSWAGSEARYLCRSGQEVVQDFELEWRGFPVALERLVAELSLLLDERTIEFVAHRIVHGGPEFTKPLRITSAVETSLELLVPLAPLHLPGSLEVIKAARKALSQIPHIGVFDTAFHATIPAVAATYPIPQQWTERWQIRRFGFHGLSHEYCTNRAYKILEDESPHLRLVIAHIGSGISITAVEDGKSIDTTMGFTPLEGMMMATRCGNLDPGLMLYLLRECSFTPNELADGLNFQSGLLGVSGVSGDLRRVIGEATNGHKPSQLAFQIYVHRLRQGIASMAASMDGLDSLVFTGGVGTHSPPVRSAVSDGLSFLGIEINPDRNRDCVSDALISTEESEKQVLVIETNEELMLCRHAVQVIMEN